MAEVTESHPPPREHSTTPSALLPSLGKHRKSHMDRQLYSALCPDRKSWGPCFLHKGHRRSPANRGTAPPRARWQQPPLRKTTAAGEGHVLLGADRRGLSKSPEKLRGGVSPPLTGCGRGHVVSEPPPGNCPVRPTQWHTLQSRA